MFWDERFSQPGFAYGTEPNDFLAGHAERYLPAKGEVVSLGEGEGRNAVFLARLGFHVTGVDASRVGLDKARALADKNGVHIHTVVADLASYDLGKDRWDGVVSIWCHTERALRARLHRAIVTALKPGGVFLLEAYTPKQLEFNTGGPKSPDLLMTLDAVRAELDGLEIVVGEEKVREVHEGTYHDGTSAVLQLVARKPKE